MGYKSCLVILELWTTIEEIWVKAYCLKNSLVRFDCFSDDVDLHQWYAHKYGLTDPGEDTLNA